MFRVAALASVMTLAFCLTSANARDRIEAVIDTSDPHETVALAAEKFAQALERNDGKIIELDLSITSRNIEAVADYAATTRGGEREVQCSQAHGQRFGDEEKAFQIQFSAYNHLLLEIVHRTGAGFPFNHAYCEYDAAHPESPVLRIKGHFVPSVVSIPTAYDVKLVPIKH